MISYLGSLVQSCCGEGGALQGAVAVCGEHWPCPGRAARGLTWRPLHGRAFSLRGPSARRRSGLRESSDRTRGLFARWEGVASLGLSLPLAPPRCLLPPAGMGRLFSGVSQSLCFANRRGVFRPVNSSLALPQFKKISLRLLSGPSGRSLP